MSCSSKVCRHCLFFLKWWWPCAWSVYYPIISASDTQLCGSELDIGKGGIYKWWLCCSVQTSLSVTVKNKGARTGAETAAIEKMFFDLKPGENGSDVVLCSCKEELYFMTWWCFTCFLFIDWFGACVQQLLVMMLVHVNCSPRDQHWYLMMCE